MKQLQEELLDFLQDEDNLDEHLFLENLNQENIQENAKKFKEYLHLISDISNNHRRTPHFIVKIEKILNFYKEYIKQSFSNFNIFNIFKNNKRILLFLIEEQFIKIDKYIALTMTSSKYENAHYYEYFLPELISFSKSEPIELSEKFSEEFREKRRRGENDKYICSLIQNDSVEDFVSHITHENIPLSATIEPSIFETNPFLYKNKPSLMEYSAFFGSREIFQYLFMNNVDLTPSLWAYAIHGNNPEMIHFLEENEVKLEYKENFIASIKCHHNEIADYIEVNFLQIDPKEFKDIQMKIIRHFNYKYFKHVIGNNLLFFYLLINDYPALVEFYLKEKEIDINKKYIQILFFP